MIILKDYQFRAKGALKAFFEAYQELNDVELAYYKSTRDNFGKGLSFTAVSELPGLPYVCLRIPTGGGKTIVACHSIGVAAKELLHTDNPVVLWLVPSNTIREQTLNALKDTNHPYHQAVGESFSTINVLSIPEALYVTRPMLSSGVTIIVSTIQAFRVDDTEGRKVYEQSGSLMDFTGIDPMLLELLDKYEDGQPIPSLSNLLKLHRPIIIVDEAHNARTVLSFETLARFNPSTIIEFTATPDTDKSPSNVLHSTSAAELKADSMIKLPIRLETRPNWKELLDDAITMRNHLEDVANEERKLTGEYIRPIMLIQAQSQSQGQERLTVEVVEKCLLEDCSIPSDQICRATGVDRGLDGVTDLLQPSCKLRYIITVQALREGWDCPFAYVLCSVAEMRSSTAVEQILGRIMRLPRAMKKTHDDLNMAYAFSASKDFVDAANALEEALVQNGFNRQDAKDFIIKAPTGKQGELEQFWNQVVEPVTETPELKTLPAEIASKVSYDHEKGEITFKGEMAEPEKKALQACFKTPEGKATVEKIFRKTKGLPVVVKSPAERGEPFSIPLLAIKQGELFVNFEDTHFLDRPWRLSQCDYKLGEAEYTQKAFDGKVIEIDITEGKIGKRFVKDLQEQMNLLTNDVSQTVVNITYWLDRNIPHKDVIPSESGAFLTALINHLIEERQFTIGQLYHDKFNLRQKVTAKIELHRKAAHAKAYQAMLLPGYENALVVTPEVCFSFDPKEYPYNTKYSGSYNFKNHYYKDIGSLNGEEEACAIHLDTLPEMDFWVRNIEKRERFSFWLQTSTDRFYPDFVCKLKDGRFLVVEYKGFDRWSDDDSKDKRNIGGLYEKRSGGKCLFIMPKGKDLAAITTKIRG
jgi:type III restriction enzyme